jgi:hypothetical protein
MLDNYIKWFKSHERILAVVIVLAVIAFIGNKWITRSYDTALAKNAVAQQVLQDQVSKNNEIAKSVDALNQQYQNLLGQVTKQNATLVQAISARNQVVSGQQRTDATLPLSDLALRQQALAGLSTGISSTVNGLQESPAAAIVVTQKLEELPALQQNVADLQTVSDNKDKQITSLTGVVDGQKTEIGGLRLQITDADKACQASAKLEVAKARKSKRTWFKIGFVTGFVGGIVTGRYIP